MAQLRSFTDFTLPRSLLFSSLLSRQTDLLVIVVAALPHVVHLALGNVVVAAGAAAVALPENACGIACIVINLMLPALLKCTRHVSPTAEEILLEP